MRKLAITVTIGLAVLALATPANAGPAVDPNTLQPVPPNATCRDDGPQVICDTFADENLVNEPNADFTLPCGRVYETSHFHGAGTRWYIDRLAVRRHVVARLEGTLSLSATGAGPTVAVSASWSIWTTWTTPGDDSTAIETSNSGNDLKVSAPGYGVILHDAGLTYPDGSHHGLAVQIPPTPEAAAALCSALMP